MAFCGNCGHQIPDDSKVCPFCGTPVNGAQAEQASSGAAQASSGQTANNEGPVNGAQTGNFQQNNGFGPQGQPNQDGPQGNFQQGPYHNQFYQHGPSQASQAINHMGENMNRMVPKTKSEGLEVACFVMAILSIKFSLSMLGQIFNIIGLAVGVVAVVLLLINKERTSNKTVQSLALVIGIVGIVLSLLGIILVAAHVPEQLFASYIVNKMSDLENLFNNFDY